VQLDHIVHDMAFTVAEYVPAGQASQTRSVVELPASATRSPGSHVVHAVQVVAFALVENEPASHAMHVRSELVVPAETTRSPGAHSDHAVQELAFVLVEYEPSSHAVHVLSELAVPSETTRSPRPHSDHATQNVAPTADQVPAAHGAHAVAPVPSVEKVPAGHALHANLPLISEQLVAPSHALVMPSHVPASHVSLVVHASPSSHALPVVGPQVPSVAAPAATLHAWQSLLPPPHALSQQTPSVQKPEAHRSSVAHAVPTENPRSSLATKMSRSPAFEVCAAPAVNGKFADCVYPVTYAAPAPSNAIPRA
jgi:hypothetical protein